MAYSSRKNRIIEDEQKPTRYYSGRQEKKVAKKVRGRQTCNSGAALFNAGDVQTENFIIECKTCMKERKSFSIQKDWINKAEEEAFAMGKHHWALSFDYGPESNEQYYIISEKDFKLLNYYLEEYGG